MNIRNLILSRRIAWLYKVTLTVLFVIIVNRSIIGSDYRAIIGYIRPLPIALTFVFGLGGILCQVKRWEIILRYEGFKLNRFTGLKTILFGNLLAFVTPGRVGELLRGLSLDEKRKGTAVFAVVVDKLFHIVTAVFFGVLCGMCQPAIFRREIHPQFFIVLGIGTVLITALIIVILSGNILPGLEVMRRYCHRIFQLCPKIFSSGGRKAVFYSIVSHLFLILQTSILMRMFGSRDILADIVAAGQAYAFMAFLPFFIGNMGIREYSFRLFFEHLSRSFEGGIPVQNAALAASMGIFVINIILPALAGLIWSLLEGKERVQSRVLSNSGEL